MPTTTPDVPPILSVRECADLLRMDEDTLRTWLREGHVAGRKVGRKWKIPRTAILDDDGHVRPIGPTYSE
jgi:excisionase family DNA binding protein